MPHRESRWKPAISMIGMTYKILPTKEFSKDFRRLSRLLQRRIKLRIEETAQHPERYKHLPYALKNSCRVRIGKLRVFFSYNVKRKELCLEKIMANHNYRWFSKYLPFPQILDMKAVVDEKSPSSCYLNSMD